jgi:hypothetical protein
MLMLASAAAHGWHLVLGQWGLDDADSRTVTLYADNDGTVVAGGLASAGAWPSAGLGGHRLPLSRARG